MKNEEDEEKRKERERFMFMKNYESRNEEILNQALEEERVKRAYEEVCLFYYLNLFGLNIY
jgi:hypothetical protein